MADQEYEPDVIIEHAESQLDDVDPGPFSPRAFNSLKIKASAYIRFLITESARISRRQRVDVISAIHVAQANDYLIGGSSQRWFRHLGTIGGIFFGASLSNFLSMTTAGEYTTNGVIISALLAVVGAFSVALHIGRDLG